ncbi:hypothetical protein DTO207G8_6209 [Paecilomyces variotii]|nr:hypothetical protein DTO207G8_6209 [Paecilomyces variotii]
MPSSATGTALRERTADSHESRSMQQARLALRLAVESGVVLLCPCRAPNRLVPSTPNRQKHNLPSYRKGYTLTIAPFYEHRCGPCANLSLPFVLIRITWRILGPGTREPRRQRRKKSGEISLTDWRRVPGEIVSRFQESQYP